MIKNDPIHETPRFVPQYGSQSLRSKTSLRLKIEIDIFYVK